MIPNTSPIDASSKQIFFDCDNTLVDTEAAAVEAAATVINKVMTDKGILYRFTVEQLIVDYFGKTARQMIVELQKELDFILTPEEIKDYNIFEEDLVIKLIHQTPLPCEGIKNILEQLFASKKYRLAVVSSSPIRRIRAALDAADIAQYFEHDHVYSAKNSMPTPKSKPDPAIYQWAMNENNVTANQCIAFEDSRSGARSALQAGITCIAYVGAYGAQDQRAQVAATLTAEGCCMVMQGHDSLFECLELVEGAMADAAQ